MQRYKIIAVDFDGTLCSNKWPEIGEPDLKLIARLKNARESGDKLILWTCRRKKNLKKAIVWCKSYGLEFDAINNNLKEISKTFGGNSRKVFADVYIDDKAEYWRKE